MMTSSFLTPEGSIQDPYRNFIALSRYARWLPDDNRRETWSETVQRYMSFMEAHLEKNYDYKDRVLFSTIEDSILNHRIMPSMRGLMTAGPVLDRCGVSIYNCSTIAVDSPRAFDEAMYILMNGTGVGFTVESKYTEQLPTVSEDFTDTDSIIIVEDSKTGWARAFRELIGLLYQGQIPKWDMSRVRPKGAVLKTFGGRASGPEPLDSLFHFTVKTFQGASGRRLKPIEAHDIMCKIGEIVVSGGVRRSALISLSDLSDHEITLAKSGQWWETHPHRALSNNSAVYNSKPSTSQFLSEWLSIYNSKSGERGIFNLDGIRRHVTKHGRRDASKIVSTNPCSEILLRSNQFCNLTEVIVEENDTEESLKEKIRLATILGTWQSTITNFKYIRKIWKDNSEEERLLGVSMTGIFGNKLTSTNGKNLADLLDRLREYSIEINKKESEILGIQQSTAITCCKPSGTVSQLALVSSGIHPWYAPYYIRSVRAINTDPLTVFLKAVGVPNEPDVMKPDETTVFYFPTKAPDEATVTSDLTAIEHLELWKTYRTHWTEHNPSVTISVKEDEWVGVGAWVYENFEDIGGVSFLPWSDHVYKQAPYQEVSKEEYESIKSKMPVINWELFKDYEKVDTTRGSQELACTSATGCEIVDIV